MSMIERRGVAAWSAVETVDASGGDVTRRIVGYAAKFNRPSEPLAVRGGSFREVIAPGAFDRTLARGADVRALVEHDAARILGRTRSGTLELSVDATGLRVSIDPPDTSSARDVIESIRRGDLDGMSFGFSVAEERGEEWDTDASGETVRTILACDLFDVSVVAFPAYPDAEVSLRTSASLERHRAFFTVEANRRVENCPFQSRDEDDGGLLRVRDAARRRRAEIELAAADAQAII